MKPDVPPLPGAAEAAASVRFQPTPEDAHVCPACYHPPHVGMCAICLCFKAVPASSADAEDDAEDDADAREDAQAGDEPVDEVGASCPRHRREIARVSLLQRLRIWVSGG